MEKFNNHSVLHSRARRCFYNRRTETNYAANQAELDGKKFPVDRAKAGVNLPPMHPYCRSTTIAVVEDGIWEMSDEEPGLNEDVPFEEWLGGLKETEDGKVRYVGTRENAAEAVDFFENGGIIEETKKFIMPESKIKHFLLKPNAKHADEFFAVGYSENDSVKLLKDIYIIFDEKNAVDIRNNADGTLDFSIFMDLGIENKKRFRTVWRKDTPNSKPRFITAHRED